MNKYFILLVFLSFSLISCSFLSSFESNISTHNEEINKEIRDEIHLINEKIIKDISNGDKSAFMDMFIYDGKKEILKAQMEKLLPQVSEIVKGRKFKIYNEYYFKIFGYKKALKKTYTISSETEDAFSLRFKPESDKSFVSLLRSENDDEDYLMTFQYVKIDKKWRLQFFYLKPYKIGKKTCYEWMNESNKLSENGCFLPAYLHILYSRQCLDPSPIMKYDIYSQVITKEKNLKDYLNKNYELPLKLNKNGTEQMLFKISPNLYNGKYSPCVEYVTTTPLNNNEELEKEAKQMIPQLEENYTGIAKDVDFILFIAYEEYPEDENKDYKVFKSAIKVNDKNKKRGQDSN